MAKKHLKQILQEIEIKKKPIKESTEDSLDDSPRITTFIINVQDDVSEKEEMLGTLIEIINETNSRIIMNVIEA